MEPRRDLPEMPAGYGVPENDDGALDWATVEQRLVESSHYWMATTRPDGRPHVVPRWGVWLDSRFWYDGSPATLHTRNLTENPACTLHLEDGWEAVILDGTSNQADPPGLELGGRLSEAFAVKYSERGYSPAPDAWEGEMAGGLRVFTPQKAMAWFDFPNDVTRFRFE
ncbi:MAG: pyridoxamine 5'-phosphate oxidase [Acidimicrobiia bacterium]|nr:pyridoxamine 5'-phosphate oxidase [Acidimicrobiia bacterium]